MSACTRTIFLAILCLTVLPTAGLCAGNPYAGKKLIYYGIATPDAADVRAKIADLEKAPFDGIVIKVMAPGTVDMGGGSLGWRVFSSTRLQPERYERAIDDLKATPFRRFTDNFIQVIAMPGDVGWFDPEWSAVAHNAACLARVARQGGCKGIMFDPEDYGEYHIWNCSEMPAEWRKGRTFEEVSARVRERGREFMRAIDGEFPDITILALFGPSYTYLQAMKRPVSEVEYGLLTAFYDGMLQAASPGTAIVDGYEFSYGFRNREKFVEGRRFIFEAERTCSDRQAFRKHVRAGFGIWIENAHRQVGWRLEDFSANYYTPAGLQASTAYALHLSDQYVWIYSELVNVFDPGAAKPYIDAIALAKTGPGVGDQSPRKLKQVLPRAADLSDYSDEKTFAKMRLTMTEVFDIPRDGWRFRRDESNAGIRQGWYRADLDDSSWRSMSVGKFWEEQGEEYDGRAWYRVQFTAPAVEKGKRVFLAFGAADESAKVWLNGRFIGERDLGGKGWDKPFAVEVTREMRPGEENLLAVQVLDRGGAGGLWKSVKVMVR